MPMGILAGGSEERPLSSCPHISDFGCNALCVFTLLRVSSISPSPILSLLLLLQVLTALRREARGPQGSALPLASRMQTWLPWRRTRGSLRSSSCLGRKPPRAPQLQETPETPPSSRAEGLLFLPGLESNQESSLPNRKRSTSRLYIVTLFI